MKKNLFIALEGIDGSGKSTQVKHLASHLKAAGHQVHTTFEPTDGPIGRMIRDIFSGKTAADHRVIAGLFVADRLNHLLNKNDGILKKLEEGYTVLSDRYYLSSYAYHAVHMPMDWVIQANAMSAELLRPDLNVFIDLPPEVSMERINRGRTAVELYETLDNLKQVRDKYFEAFEKVKGQEKIFITHSDRDPKLVAVDIWKAVAELFEDV